MRVRATLRDVVLLLAAVLGGHALLVSIPSRLAREAPSAGVLSITAPDCATSWRDVARPVFRGAPGGTRPEIPASPIRR